MPLSYDEQVGRLLRSVWREPRPPGAPARVRRDWALVAVLVPLALVEGVLRTDLAWRGVTVAMTVLLVPTLLWRRTHPLPMVVIGFGATALVTLLTAGESDEPATLAHQLILIYALFRWGSGREAVLGLVPIGLSMAAALGTGRLAPADTAGALAVVLAALALGVAFRYRARARMRELEQAKLLERERLARDLHDTVAHHISAMAIRAQAGLATAGTRPEAATEALRVIEAEAARALDEMRAMVRLLRHDDRGEPVRGIADLPELANGEGPAVDVAVCGDLGGLSPSVGAAIYRLAQESVTNARRHARHATRIEVRVEADDTSVHLRVSDDGDGGPARRQEGYGLMGMKERAGLLGGTCVAGPGPGRGWTVTAVLPRSGAPA